MIQAYPNPLPQSKVDQLRVWMRQQPESQIFRDYVNAVASQHQVDAARLLVESVRNVNALQDAQEKAKLADEYFNLLRLFDLLMGDQPIELKILPANSVTEIKPHTS